MADTNKVKFGIKEAHYSILTEDENGAITYGEVKPIKGSRAFSFSLDYNILRNIGNYREIMENVERSGGKVQESQR